MNVTEKSSIPMVWFFAAIASLGTGVVVVGGIIFWAAQFQARAESRADSQGEKISKLEMTIEQERMERQAIQATLVEIKILLQKK